MVWLLHVQLFRVPGVLQVPEKDVASTLTKTSEKFICSNYF